LAPYRCLRHDSDPTKRAGVMVTPWATPPALGLVKTHCGHEQLMLLQHCNFWYTSKIEQI
jgi:hypothetical protein